MKFSQCRWDDYYELSQEIYKNNGESINEKANLYDLTVIEHNNSSPVMDTSTEEYKNIITDLSERVNKLFEEEKYYTFRPIAYGLDNIWHCKKELEALGNYLIPQLQKRVFKSYVHVDNIKIYRSPESNIPDASSWLWHFDNSPKEQIKILIYLSDVGEDCGEFTYLKKNGHGCKVPTSRISWDEWTNQWDNPPAEFLLKENGLELRWAGTTRVPSQAISILKEKFFYETYKAVGKMGTLFLFDNNIIHKATVPKNKYRDVIVLQFKPSIKKMDPYIGERTTGNGHEHTTFNVDPSILVPVEQNKENHTSNQLRIIRQL